jgi:Recombinase
MRQRDRITSGTIDMEAIARRQREGWKLVALEWERQSPDDPVQSAVDPPFGYQVAGDCSRLEEHPAEAEILRTIMRGVVHDQPLSDIADELNRRGFRTRAGDPWNAAKVFRLMPDLINNGPRILSAPDWPAVRDSAAANVHF